MNIRLQSPFQTKLDYWSKSLNPQQLADRVLTGPNKARARDRDAVPLVKDAVEKQFKAHAAELTSSDLPMLLRLSALAYRFSIQGCPDWDLTELPQLQAIFNRTLERLEAPSAGSRQLVVEQGVEEKKADDGDRDPIQGRRKVHLEPSSSEEQSRALLRKLLEESTSNIASQDDFFRRIVGRNPIGPHRCQLHELGAALIDFLSFSRELFTFQDLPALRLLEENIKGPAAMTSHHRAHRMTAAMALIKEIIAEVSQLRPRSPDEAVVFFVDAAPFPENAPCYVDPAAVRNMNAKQIEDFANAVAQEYEPTDSIEFDEKNPITRGNIKRISRKIANFFTHASDEQQRTFFRTFHASDDFQRFPLREEFVTTLIHSLPRQMNCLDMQLFRFLTDDHVQFIVKNIKGLKLLVLDCYRVTAAGMEAIAKSKLLSGLEELMIISYKGDTNAACLSLLKSPYLKLQDLTFFGSKKSNRVDEQTLRQLERKFRKVYLS